VRARLLLVIAAVVALAAAAAVPSRGGSDTLTVTFPIVKCAMTFVGGSRTSPSSYTATVPATLAQKLSAYGGGGLVVLAPRGWRCTGIVGGDGSEVISAGPRSEAPENFNSRSTTARPWPYAIEADDASQCAGCQADTACPFFPNAIANVHQTGTSCYSLRTPTELVSHLSSYAVRYEDSPGVKGTGGDWSGGSADVIGTVVFLPNVPAKNLYSWAASSVCAEPASLRSICLASSAAFAVRESHR
jgi:hypothetical protein